MRGFLRAAAALVLAVSAQSSFGQASEAGLRGAVNAPPPSVFRDAVHGTAIDSAAAVTAAMAPQGRAGAMNLTAVPEPSSVALIASGAVGLVGALWRRRRGRAE